MHNIIRIDYEVVKGIASSFSREAERIRQISQALNRRSEVLRAGDWQGKGAQAFYQEMGSAILPAFGRLEKALVEANRITLLIFEIFRQTESEVASYFRISGSEGETRDSKTGEAPVMPIGIGGVLLIGGLILIIGGGVAAIWWLSQNLRGLSDADAQKKVEDILNNSEIGREAVQKAKDLGVSFKLSTAGSGTYYDSSTNTIYVDPNTQPDFAASSYIHELTHAQQHTQQWPDVMALSRDDYVTATLTKEADAVIAEFRYEKQNGLLDFVSSPSYEQAYWNTYNQKYAELKNNDPNLAETELQRLANEAGREKLLESYRDGTIETSTTNQSYVDYYGNAWDVNHPTPPPASI
jgi:WXG100 family type VII secretion target